MEIKKTNRGTNPEIFTDETKGNPPVPARSNVDLLVSAGKTVTWTVGWGLWKCTSFFFRTSWWLLIRAFSKPAPEVAPVDLTDLSTPEKFHKVFKESPFSVVKTLLDLMHDHPITAEKVLVMVAKDYKQNYETYTPYQGNEKQCYQNRKNWINQVDGIVTQCILAPKLWEIEEKSLMGEMEEDQAAAISAKDEEYNPSKYSERGQEFRRQYKEAQRVKADFAQIWGTLFYHLAADENLSYLDLESDNKTVNPIPKEAKTFGVFLERLLYKMDSSSVSLYKLTNFENRDTFDRWADYAIEKLGFLKRETSNSQLKLFCDRFLSILNEEEKRTTFFNICGRVIKILRSGISSENKAVKKE